jgi:hypothetical protein
MPLMRIELDFLLDKRVFSKAQQLYIRCRLNKKVRAFLSSEFTILQDTAYIVGTLQPAATIGIAWLGYGSRLAMNTSLMRILL